MESLFFKKIPFLFLMLLLLLQGCKKYEDGPRFSLRTKKARLTGTWTLEKLESGGRDVTYMSLAPASECKMVLGRDGSYSQSIGNSSASGNWDFGGSKLFLEITLKPNNARLNYTIRRLTNKELWLELGDIVHKFKQ